MIPIVEIPEESEEEPLLIKGARVAVKHSNEILLTAETAALVWGLWEIFKDE